MRTVALRQVMSLSGHLWNASWACKCNSYLFKWGNIKLAKTVHQAYNKKSYLKSPMKSDNNCIINVVYFAQIALKKRISQARTTSASWTVLGTCLRALTVSTSTGTSASCSDALTLLIRDWLFCSEGGASFNGAAILSVAFFPIHNYTSGMSCVFYSLWKQTTLAQVPETQLHDLVFMKGYHNLLCQMLKLNLLEV